MHIPYALSLISARNNCRRNSNRLVFLFSEIHFNNVRAHPVMRSKMRSAKQVRISLRKYHPMLKRQQEISLTGLLHNLFPYVEKVD